MPSSRQPGLFDLSPEPWEADDLDQSRVARVVIPSGPPRELDYRVPDELLERVGLGRRLRVPLGKRDRLVIGYCVAIETLGGASRLKSVAEVVDDYSLISPAMLRLTRWLADYYLCSWAAALETAAPAGVKTKAGTRLTTFLSAAAGATLKLDESKLSPKQREVIRYLAASPAPLTPQQLARGAKCGLAPIATLRRRGLILSETKRVRPSEFAERGVSRDSNLDLNAEQGAALNGVLQALRSGKHETLLLHGVTGSGKTEIYLRAIQEVVSYGRQAIVLVPEISLTPQAQERFRARFGSVAVLHSHQSDAERHWQWERIAKGEVSVVVGARSAVFAPTYQLGLIVLDEEHEASFKQDMVPRYHAREVALERARAENVPLLLGSATPSLESWRRASDETYRLLTLPRRVFDRPLPDVAIVDLRDESRSRESRGAIGRQLGQAMRQTLAQDGQVILLLNRRGYSTKIQCPACGVVAQCPDCAIALTHHKGRETALCHYCDYVCPAPTRCPACDFMGIRYSGIGTQRLEAEIRSSFPEYPLLRMDGDTMRLPGAHERALDEFRAGHVRILLGTQMIAKGLDFPQVTLVGVINADTALHFPDFRAAERTFQLLVQVAGRTGRGDRGGRVLVQTFSPEHPAIIAAAKQDFRSFADSELASRMSLGYPPWGGMIRVIVRGPVEKTTSEFAASLGSAIVSAASRLAPEGRVLGPAPAPFAKLRGNFRFHLIVQGTSLESLRQSILAATKDLKPPEDIQWIADVDPLDML